MIKISGSHFFLTTLTSIGVSGLILFACSNAEQGTEKPWFGLTLPPGLGDPHKSIVEVSTIQPAPAVVPAGEENYSELSGEKIFGYVEDIVEFSKQSRAGGDKVWGRVAGFPAQQRTAEWVAEHFRDAGLQQVEVQQYSQDSDMWWSNAWQVTIKGDARFGEGSEDIVLESALPTSGSFITNGTLSAQPIYVGAVREPIPDVDVSGKIAVQAVNPERSAYTERTPARERAQQLMAKGAVAVLNIVNQHGNMHVRDLSGGDLPGFNLGSADGKFLLALMQQAENHNQLAQLQVELSLQAKNYSDLSAYNTMGLVFGDNNDEIIIINAHTDGWFDGAGDNADGLGILIAMARHFNQPQHKPARTLLFVASGGHHSRGLNGPAHFVAMNSDLVNKAVLVLNLEHNAQLYIDGGSWQAEPIEQQMSWSNSNENPWLTELSQRGMERYGFNLNPEFRATTPGDLGGYRQLNIPMHQAIHSGALYHTSGDVLETISIPGLERAARFQTYFIDQVAQAGRDLFGDK